MPAMNANPGSNGKTQATSSASLSIVATPIGNLEDITLRALRILKSVDVIACEDTRHSGRLLKHYGIEKPKISVHDHNEAQKAAVILQFLREGKSVALISDAGTPLISDPGWRVAKDAADAGYNVTWIPGPTALIGALVLSGLPSDRFIFEGFLPAKKAQRCKRLEQFKGERRTIVVYESPHRLLRTLEDIAATLGDIPVSCSRELTKQFEETRRGKAGDLLKHFTEHKPRGEFVLVLEPRGD